MNSKSFFFLKEKSQENWIDDSNWETCFVISGWYQVMFIQNVDEKGVPAGYEIKNFLHWDFIYSSVYTEFRFISELDLHRFHCTCMLFIWSWCLWCLMPLSTIFQLNRGSQFYWWGPGENHQPVVSHWETLSHNVVSSTPHLSWVQTQNVNGERHCLHR
jgi:hypothetical protein